VLVAPEMEWYGAAANSSACWSSVSLSIGRMIQPVIPSRWRRWRHRCWDVAATDLDQPAAQRPLGALVAAVPDLGQELVRADRSFGDALVQVGLEDIEDAVPGGAVWAEQVLGGGGVGVTVHGLGVRAEPAGDRVDTDALLAQGVDVGVPVAGALHPQPFRHRLRCRCRLCRCWRFERRL
jgi:hypothetical protein